MSDGRSTHPTTRGTQAQRHAGRAVQDDRGRAGTGAGAVVAAPAGPRTDTGVRRGDRRRLADRLPMEPTPASDRDRDRLSGRSSRLVGSGLWSTHAAYHWHAGDHTARAWRSSADDDPLRRPGLRQRLLRLVTPSPRGASAATRICWPGGGAVGTDPAPRSRHARPARPGGGAGACRSPWVEAGTHLRRRQALAAPCPASPAGRRHRGARAADPEGDAAHRRHAQQAQGPWGSRYRRSWNAACRRSRRPPPSAPARRRVEASPWKRSGNLRMMPPLSMSAISSACSWMSS